MQSVIINTFLKMISCVNISENASTKRKMFPCGQGGRILNQPPRSQHQTQSTRRANSSMADDLSMFNAGFSCFRCRFNFVFMWMDEITYKLTINMCLRMLIYIAKIMLYSVHLGVDRTFKLWLTSG